MSSSSALCKALKSGESHTRRTPVAGAVVRYKSEDVEERASSEAVCSKDLFEKLTGVFLGGSVPS